MIHGIAQKLVVFFGGRRSTCFQEAGFPDFMMTANADMSRNYSAGVYLAKNRKIAYESEKGTAEGVNTSIAVYKLFEKMKKANVKLISFGIESGNQHLKPETTSNKGLSEE